MWTLERAGMGREPQHSVWLRPRSKTNRSASAQLHPQWCAKISEVPRRLLPRISRPRQSPLMCERQIPPIAIQFENERSRYYRALRIEYQDHFDRLFDQARNFVGAGRILNHSDPLTTHLISILLSHEFRLTEIEKQLEDLESQTNTTVQSS